MKIDEIFTLRIKGEIPDDKVAQDLTGEDIAHYWVSEFPEEAERLLSDNLPRGVNAVIIYEGAEK